MAQQSFDIGPIDGQWLRVVRVPLDETASLSIPDGWAYVTSGYFGADDAEYAVLRRTA